MQHAFVRQVLGMFIGTSTKYTISPSLSSNVVDIILLGALEGGGLPAA